MGGGGGSWRWGRGLLGEGRGGGGSDRSAPKVDHEGGDGARGRGGQLRLCALSGSTADAPDGGADLEKENKIEE